MANGVPIRLSAALAERARAAASLLDRSLTEQVEHWARLGLIVEASVSYGTVEQLKTRSYDPRLPALLAHADSPAGKAEALALIRARNEHRHGSDADGPIYRMDRKGKKSRPAKRG